MDFRRIGTAALIAAVLGAALPVSAAVLDDFTDGTPIEPSTMAIISAGQFVLPTPSYAQSGLSGVVGGSREIQLIRTIGNTDGDIIARRDDTLDRMEFQTQANTDTADFRFFYDGTADSNYSPALDANLTTGGTNAFGFLFSAGTSAGTTVVDVSVTDTGSDTDTKSFNINGPTSYTLLYSTFSGLIDFTHIAGVQITIHGITDGDYNLDLFESTTAVVPEPATAGLIALGAGLIFTRRRR